MIHFFPAWSKDAGNTPLGAELRRLEVPHRILADKINQRYRTPFGLVFRVYPRMIGFAIRSALRSLAFSRPPPSAVVIATDVETLIFWLVRAIARRRALIVYQSFIVTPKASALKNWLHLRYFGLVVAAIDVAICHSSLEVDRNRARFPRSRDKFVFVPFGISLTDREAILAGRDSAQRPPYVVSAGRACRDYQTLANAMTSLPYDLDILCDTEAPVAGLASERIRIRRDCFGRDYLDALANALFVVIPLSTEEISAGQMVLLAAAALGKAVIITRTGTTEEYATDGEDALFVSIRNVAEMRSAITTLWEDPALRLRIGQNAAARFDRDHSTERYVRALVSVINAALRPEGGDQALEWHYAPTIQAPAAFNRQVQTGNFVQRREQEGRG
jgi:glycosyltransferase involved in cell wall biosynthesis